MRGIPAKKHGGPSWRLAENGQRLTRSSLGKVLGIVGYGHIGSQLGILAEGLGMKVIYHDIVDKLPLGNAEPAASLDDLLQVADVLSLMYPIPNRPET